MRISYLALLLASGCGTDAFNYCTELTSSYRYASAEVCANSRNYWPELAATVDATERAYNDFYSKDLDLWALLRDNVIGVSVVQGIPGISGCYDRDSSVIMCEHEYYWTSTLGHELLHFVGDKYLHVSSAEAKAHSTPGMFEEHYPFNIDTCERLMDISMMSWVDGGSR